MRKIANGTRIRLVSDKCGDLPVRYLGRKGRILRRKHNEDDWAGDAYNSYPAKAYWVKMDDRKAPFVLFDDEIRVIYETY